MDTPNSDSQALPHTTYISDKRRGDPGRGGKPGHRTALLMVVMPMMLMMTIVMMVVMTMVMVMVVV